ncbi:MULTISPECIES: AraC family transcriptional regulator [unclassified Sphingobacterium]|uniref:AraC family transcriptional regulator n=1 Tax=unclassified Sphingobacterium TaxID=2609468 RepID=UPI0025EB70E0|nr:MULTISPECIES: AraC family transcriptional regulator [unclassified Sphingobacterium]
MDISLSNELLDSIGKESYVWFDNNWVHAHAVHGHRVAQFVYVEKGFQYLEAGGKIHLLPQNHAAWIPPNMLHKTSTDASHVQLRTIFYRMDDIPEFYNELRIFQVPPVLKEMIRYAEKWNKISDYCVEEDTFLKAILLEMPNFWKHSLSLHIPAPKDSRLISVCAYIHGHLAGNWTVAEVAERHYLSLRSLQRIFKSETGITLAKYIQMVRVIKSVELLGTGRYTVSQVANRVGYKSVQAFSDSFCIIIKERPHTFLI